MKKRDDLLNALETVRDALLSHASNFDDHLRWAADSISRYLDGNARTLDEAFGVVDDREALPLKTGPKSYYVDRKIAALLITDRKGLLNEDRSMRDARTDRLKAIAREVGRDLRTVQRRREQVLDYLSGKKRSAADEPVVQGIAEGMSTNITKEHEQDVREKLRRQRDRLRPRYK